MKITSINTNGIRSAARKGFFDWVEREAPDIVCVQETKAQIHQLGDEIFCPTGYHCRYHDARKPGYSGVAIYSRAEPDRIIEGINWPEFDAEGRYLEYRFGNLSVISLYMPSGSSGEERQQVKFGVMNHFMPLLKKYRKRKREYIICGDWNIAHTKMDIKNWRGNQKNSGFLPEERAWMDELFGSAGWVDAFRVVNKEDEQYTWWSNRGQAWAKNVGWRIDYQIITPGLADKVKSASIYKDERFSDHAPLTLEYAMRVEDFR